MMIMMVVCFMVAVFDDGVVIKDTLSNTLVNKHTIWIDLDGLPLA